MKSFRTLLILICVSTSLPAQTITQYSVYTAIAKARNTKEQFIVLRSFVKQNQRYFLSVSPQSMITRIIRSDTVKLKSAGWSTIRSQFSSSPYVLALQQTERNSDTLQDAGFKRFRKTQKGIDLTIDLCPSHRPLDRIVFVDMIKELSCEEKPVPVAISITGLWMQKHQSDLEWLDSLERVGDLSILWVNHTFHHVVKNNEPLKLNFMLTPGIDVLSEVLLTEQALLEQQIVPSVFFRFPGLVSDKIVFEKVLALGIIPIGSDAWLAKGQKAKNGTIVLIHANGNEPLGIKDFIELLKNKQEDVRHKNWELFDLRESIVDDESKE